MERHDMEIASKQFRISEQRHPAFGPELLHCGGIHPVALCGGSIKGMIAPDRLDDLVYAGADVDAVNVSRDRADDWI
jgi:hypothetical protein